jgi:metal-responsive CopG/Arc/MetJ family transcriptional regulator
MKTAISVEDGLMEEADEAARDLGLSRSALIAAALREYLRQLRQARLTEQLSRAYTSGQDREERRLVRKLRKRVPSSERW